MLLSSQDENCSKQIIVRNVFRENIRWDLNKRKKLNHAGWFNAFTTWDAMLLLLCTAAIAVEAPVSRNARLLMNTHVSDE